MCMNNTYVRGERGWETNIFLKKEKLQQALYIETFWREGYLHKKSKLKPAATKHNQNIAKNTRENIRKNT